MKISIRDLILIMIIISIPISYATEDEGDIAVFGLELEKLLHLINGILATTLCIISYLAYRREKRKRVLYVSIAFLLFAIKGFLASSELFIQEITFIDPLAVILESAIIGTFFFGMLKK